MRQLFLSIWSGSETCTSENEKPKHRINGADRSPVNNAPHPSKNTCDNELYQLLNEQPESNQVREICSTETLFQKITPGAWRTAAKEHSSLFKAILQNPKLATWVNQSPTDRPRGLLLIATFSTELSNIAQQYGKGVMSEEDMEIVERSTSSNMFSQTA